MPEPGQTDPRRARRRAGPLPLLGRWLLVVSAVLVLAVAAYAALGWTIHILA